MARYFRYSTFVHDMPSYIAKYTKAREKMLDQLADYSQQQEMNQLSSILNAIIRDASFQEDKIAEQILQRLPQVAQQGVEEGVNDYVINGAFRVSTPELESRWNAYRRAVADFKQQEQELVNIADDDNIKSLFSKAMTIQGRVNGVQGQAFESFLQAILPLIKSTSKESITEIIDNLEKSLSSQTSITTMGTQTRTITAVFNKELVEVSSQGKVDVQAKVPFLSDDIDLKITAKNYARLSNIHILSSGRLVGLVGQWQVSAAAQDYFYQAMSVWQSPTDVYNAAHALFGIQALSGTGAYDSTTGLTDLADVLIVNIRTRKNPIVVVSIKALLKQILEDANIKNAFDVKYSAQLQLFDKEEEHDGDEISIYDWNDMYERVRPVTLNVSLKKNVLTANYLRKLQ